MTTKKNTTYRIISLTISASTIGLVGLLLTFTGNNQLAAIASFIFTLLLQLGACILSYFSFMTSSNNRQHIYSIFTVIIAHIIFLILLFSGTIVVSFCIRL